MSLIQRKTRLPNLCSLFFYGRAALVREATRFKSTRDAVDVPARNAEVINRSVDGSVEVHLPQVIARAVLTAIINSSVAFELCVVCPFSVLGD